MHNGVQQGNKAPADTDSKEPHVSLMRLANFMVLRTSISSTHTTQTISIGQDPVLNHKVRIAFDLRLRGLIEPLDCLLDELRLVVLRSDFLELGDPDRLPVAGGDGVGHGGLEGREVVVDRARAGSGAAVPKMIH